MLLYKLYHSKAIKNGRWKHVIIYATTLNPIKNNNKEIRHV